MQLYFGNIVDFSENIFDKDKICGIMGLKYHYENSYYGKFKGLEYILKMNDISNSSFWSIEFFDDSQKSKNGNFDGYLILGAGDHKYLKDIKNITEDNIHFSYNTYTVGSLEWISHFQSVYYYKSKDEKVEMSYDFSNVGFNFDNRYYFSSKEYFESIKLNFFNEYLKKGICTIHELKEFYLRYKYITCNKKNFNEEKNKFPILYFFSSGFNYTFELTYNDLFIDINDDILFLMFFDPWNPKIFKFGEKFMTKYQLLFVIDQKNIGFINYSKREEKKDKDEKQDFIKKKRKFEIIWVIVLLVLLVGIIIGILVGNKLWDNKRYLW